MLVQRFLRRSRFAIIRSYVSGYDGLRRPLEPIWLSNQISCRDPPAGSGIPGGFPCFVILPALNAEGSITALAAKYYEQSGVAQESLDRHTGSDILVYTLAWVCRQCSTAFPIAIGKGGVLRKPKPLYEDGKRVDQ